MGICYSDERQAGGNVVPYHKINANKGYLTHWSNKMLLDFIIKQSRDARERAQARMEMEVCERKLAYMQRHVNFCWDVVRPEIERLTKAWQGRRA